MDLVWDLVPVGQVVARSDILLPASRPSRLSRAIRTPGRAIFADHPRLLGTVGMRIGRGLNHRA